MAFLQGSPNWSAIIHPFSSILSSTARTTMQTAICPLFLFGSIALVGIEPAPVLRVNHRREAVSMVSLPTEKHLPPGRDIPGSCCGVPPLVRKLP